MEEGMETIKQLRANISDLNGPDAIGAMERIEENLEALEKESAGYKQTIEKVWEALGAERYSQGEGKYIWEIVADLKRERDEWHNKITDALGLSRSFGAEKAEEHIKAIFGQMAELRKRADEWKDRIAEIARLFNCPDEPTKPENSNVPNLVRGVIERNRELFRLIRKMHSDIMEVRGPDSCDCDMYANREDLEDCGICEAQILVDSHRQGFNVALGKGFKAIANGEKPTPWAYKKACEALEKHRKRADLAAALIKDIRETTECPEGENLFLHIRNHWIPPTEFDSRIMAALYAFEKTTRDDSGEGIGRKWDAEAEKAAEALFDLLFTPEDDRYEEIPDDPKLFKVSEGARKVVEELREQENISRCNRCNGDGLSYEGLPCSLCKGTGEIETAPGTWVMGILPALNSPALEIYYPPQKRDLFEFIRECLDNYYVGLRNVGEAVEKRKAAVDNAPFCPLMQRKCIWEKCAFWGFRPDGSPECIISIAGIAIADKLRDS